MKSAKGSTGCFPACWASSDQWVYRMAVGVFGVAFLIAFITQAQNGFSNRWHVDLKIKEITKIEKGILYVLGHLGFLARAGVRYHLKTCDKEKKEKKKGLTVILL